MSRFACAACGFVAVRFYVNCPRCDRASTMAALALDQLAASDIEPGGGPEIVSLDDALSVDDEPRLLSGVPPWDAVLGGGQLAGTVAIIGGDPGLGKSTLALQVLCGLRRRGAHRALYVSSEEPVERVAQRGARIGVSMRGIAAVAEQMLPEVLVAVRRAAPLAFVVDSVQAVYDPAFPGAPGSVSQVRRAGWQLVKAARDLRAVAILLAHVDKGGEFAGPMVLQHDVDVVAMLEGDPAEPLRLLKVRKNRFGPTTGVGRFEMTEEGLQ